MMESLTDMIHDAALDVIEEVSQQSGGCMSLGWGVSDYVIFSDVTKFDNCF